MTTTRQMRSALPVGAAKGVLSTGVVSQSPKEQPTSLLASKEMAGMEWREPEIRAPVPSFEDFKGLERHGVLEHMAPLGSLPGNKARTRARGQDASNARRNGHSRRHDTLPIPRTKEALSTAHSSKKLRLTTHNNLHAPSGLRVTTSSPGTSPSRTYSSQHDQSLPQLTSQSPRSQSPIQPSSEGVTSISLKQKSIRTPRRWQKIVDSAVKRASDLGNADLGLAIRKLYEESLHDQGLALLLDSVLSQQQSSQQAAAFQAYVRRARKKLKQEMLRQSYPSASSNFSENNDSNPSVNGINGTSDDIDRSSTPFNDKKSNHVTLDIPAEVPQPHDSSASRVLFEDEGGSRKRRKRSASVSSASSLSSLTSTRSRMPTNNEAMIGDTDLPDDTVQDASDPSPPIKDEKAEALAESKRSLRKFGEERMEYSNVRPTRNRPRPVTPAPDASIKSSDASKSIPTQPEIPDSSTPPNESTLQIDTATKKVSMDGDSELSSALSSRSLTPMQVDEPSKRSKRGARIKQSPLKKKTGVTAGVALQTETESLGGAGKDDDSNSEHGDACCACGGNGTLLLCDDCPRAYHMTCCDPPIDPKLELPEEWRCRPCSAKAITQTKESEPGIWTKMMLSLQQKNPASFSLPKKLREYFEGVITTDEGEYDEIPSYKLTKPRSGYEEQTDNLKIRDRMDRSVLCFRCGLSSMGKHEIATCDYCTLHWHLDCLDPPAAYAPNRKTNMIRPRATWMCPNHVEQELMNIKLPLTHSQDQIRKMQEDGASDESLVTKRRFKMRRPKKPAIVDSDLRRGFRNNGMIEIMEVESDDGLDDDEIEREINGVIFRVPEKGIKLDFVDRVKQSRALETMSRLVESRQRPWKANITRHEDRRARKSHGSKSEPFLKLQARPFKERKAALHLAQMAQHRFELGSDRITNLIATLTSEAPPSVESLLDKQEELYASSAATLRDSPGDEECMDLEIIIELAQQRLALRSPKAAAVRGTYQSC